MPFTRAQELLVSLQRELSAATAKGHLDPLGRRRWLLDQLDNYLDRWIAFAAVGVSMKSLLRDDLFTMLRVGVQVYSSEIEIARGKNLETDEWQKFVALMSQVCESHSKAMLAELRSALTNVRKATRTETDGEMP
jgi:hypothetical protein